MYVNFNHLIFSMQNEKDRFLVEKAAKYHTERFKQSITTVIEISTNWKMHDYRCQNFQKQAETFFWIYRTAYLNKYGQRPIRG